MHVRRFYVLFGFALAMVVASGVSASPAAFAVAELVQETDTAVVEPAVAAALKSPETLVRATAARVVAVRSLVSLLPTIREALASETDATAAREEIRALGLVGDAEDVAMAKAASSRWPAGMDDSLALAVARRGGVDAVRIYASLLRDTRMSNHSEFFRLALWQSGQSLPLAASRMLGDADEKGWSGLLAALLESNAAMHAPVLASSLDSPSEKIRNASVWYLVRSYAASSDSIPAIVAEKIAAGREELSSDREDFGRELLRRMRGGSKIENDRWIEFLDSEEADRIFRNASAALEFLTDREYGVRYARCEVQSHECAMERKWPGRRIPSRPVSPPAFDLPSVLPAGLAESIVDGARCRSRWIGVAEAAVDQAGRLQKADLDKVTTSNSCRRALDTILRLSLATNTSVNSPLAGPVLLVSANASSICLDEAPPGEKETGILAAGEAVQVPKIIKRVAPQFPATARRAMSGATNVSVVAEAIISKTGCIRSVWLVSQSPYPELNGALVLALSQWQFAPGTLDGEPVDVRFTLTTNFRTH